MIFLIFMYLIFNSMLLYPMDNNDETQEIFSYEGLSNVLKDEFQSPEFDELTFNQFLGLKKRLEVTRNSRKFQHLAPFSPPLLLVGWPGNAKDPNFPKNLNNENY